MLRKILFAAGLLPAMLHFTAAAQDTTRALPAISLSSSSKITFSGMLQTQFNYSFDHDIDITGRHHTGNETFSRNSFSVKRARMQLNAAVNDRINAVILVNFGDFTGNPQNKVLENAYIRYHVNDYINFQVGQFRPQFGQEDMYPVDLVRSVDYSNQYYLFGANSWQSFQIGLSYSGEVKQSSVPVKYAIGVFNGNNRNQVSDDDNGKIVPARVALGLGKSTWFGLNGGFGKNTGKKIWAYGFDLDYKKMLNDRWNVELVSEYKQGINSQQFFAEAPPLSPVNDYQMRGVYALPNVGYNFKRTRLKSLEMAFRYEYLDADFKREGNARQSYIPMLSASFADSYAIRLQVGLLMDRYETNIPNTSKYDTNRLICQVQARF